MAYLAVSSFFRFLPFPLAGMILRAGIRLPISRLGGAVVSPAKTCADILYRGYSGRAGAVTFASGLRGRHYRLYLRCNGRR